MQFRFYINEVEVDEPVGFDATKVTLKRSDMWHGVMVETSEETMDFYGDGFQILKGLYDESGIDAVAVLRIDYLCDGVIEDSVSYNITFYEYNEYCGDDCYCSVGIERTGCFYKFRNAMDTKVNLDAVKSIDNVTDLANYEYLGKEIEVPSKTIVLSDSGKLTENQHQDWWTDVTNTFVVNPGGVEFFIYIPIEQDLYEMDTFEPNASVLWWVNAAGGSAGQDGEELYLFTNQFNGQLCGNNTEFNVKARIKADVYSDVDALGGTPTIKVVIFKKKVDNSYVYIYESADLCVNVGDTHSANIDLTIDTSFTLEADERLEYAIRYNFVATSGTAFNELYADIYTESTFLLTNNSLCDATPAKMYLINEALSHISEYVTDNCLRVYSEYLGRTDSQPFSFNSDNCAGMLALTNGLFLRQIDKVKTGDKAPILSLSFNDVLNAVNTIYPLGFTVENNGTIEVLRIENWEHFYNDIILFDIGSVSVKKEPNLSLHFKNYKTGYSRYEAEEYNGLDEFLTEREYTTNLVNHNQALEKVCQFVASGYAIEITRRKGNTDTKDWRFDNETFIISLDRIESELHVEQGNIVDDVNIIDAPTILNYRISPARMAMNWFKYILAFKKSIKNLIFSSGKGNTSAGGELISQCKIESGVILENQNIEESDFSFSQLSLYDAELHTIDEFPLTFRQYLQVKSNPHALIGYNCSGGQMYGWIKEFKYNIIEGIASAIIIPKNS